MKKRVLPLLLIVVMVYSMNSNAAFFTDMTIEDWFYENVEILIEAGIISGYPDGTFKPENTMTVDEFIKTMVVALGEDPGNADGYWAQNYIDLALDMGILQEGDFSDFTTAISREKMSILSVRTIESLEGDQDYKYGTGSNEVLYSSISDMSDVLTFTGQAYIQHAYELGILTGYPDGSFQPRAILKRSEAATVILRVIDDSYRTPYEEPVMSEWDSRAEEIFEETGIKPFESANTDNKGTVYTEDVLTSTQRWFSFDSWLTYDTEDPLKETWVIRYSFVSARESEDNMNTQLFELEYIMENLHGIDSSLVEEVKESLITRTGGTSTPNEYWDLGNGATLRISPSTNTTKVVDISAIGFGF